MFSLYVNNYITSISPSALGVREAALNLIVIHGTVSSRFACFSLRKTFFQNLYSTLSSLNLYKCFPVGQFKSSLEAHGL